MKSITRPSTRTASNLVQPRHEAPTPTISNCASPNKLPPPLSLGSGGRSSSCKGLSSQEARFSCPTAEPINMERPLLEETPVSFSPRVASLPQSPGQRSALSENYKRRASSLPQKQDEFSFLALTIHENCTTVSADAGDVIFWSSLIGNIMPFYLPVICDLIKTGVPLKLLQRTVLALWQRVVMGGGTLSHAPLLKHSQPRRASTDTTPGRNISFSNSPQLRQGMIQGIPNFGQTCFMNSVLQSLASLEPFLTYLDRINRVQQDQVMMTQFASLPTTTPPAASSSDGFAEQLLQILLAANGLDSTSHRSHKSHNRLKIDPRPLLRRIGQEHAQFEQRGEQQDAQEYLQALLGVVISDAHLDSITAASDHMRFTETRGIHAAEEPITNVVAGAEGQREKFDLRMEESMLSSDSGSSGVCANSALSLSSLGERIDENQKAIRNSTVVHSKEGTVESSCSNMPTTVEEESSSAQNRSSGDSDNYRPLPEEKKQEDFEVAVPFRASEECLEALGRKSNAPLSEVMRMQTNGTASTVSESSWEYYRQTQSKAMKIVQSTISSITPSPLSGWLGSTIQCCNCEHVRPIRNSPFLDIPLVPTSVPAYLARAHSKDPPPNSSPLPPCSIEQCLAEFTSVERVQDVECRFCTIQSEIVELQEEEMLLSGAIESTEKRIKAKGGDSLTQTKSLKEELRKIQLRLVKLQTMDPDEDDLQLMDENINNEEDFLSGDDLGAKPSRLARCDARKCLVLTRCPSILCCHIQRRYYDPYSNCMEKCVQHVQFEEILNLAPYCPYSPEASTSWVAGSSRHSHHANTKKYRQMLYRLESLVEHRGNAHGGHYICYRRFGKSWFRISDHTVSHISWKEVRNCQAYMLFYEAM
jgi:ubiquitin C-terminal hydrolase